MKLPAPVKATRDAFVARFPVPHTPPQTPESLDDALRAWCIQFAQQVRFTTNDPHWGAKRADPGRPISKDSLAWLDGAVLHMWDLFRGASSGQGEVNQDPDSLDVPIFPAAGGQTFVAVEAHDWLQLPPPGPTPGPAPTPARLLADYFAFRDVIVRIYREELRREVIADPDALVNWLFHWREEGHDEAWIRARIRESAEWTSTHGSIA